MILDLVKFWHQFFSMLTFSKRAIKRGDEVASQDIPASTSTLAQFSNDQMQCENKQLLAIPLPSFIDATNSHTAEHIPTRDISNSDGRFEWGRWTEALGKGSEKGTCVPYEIQPTECNAFFTSVFLIILKTLWSQVATTGSRKTNDSKPLQDSAKYPSRPNSL